MKFCPVCRTRYDEEILRFCTKDGTPLVEEMPPNFTGANDDSDEETVIRRKPKANSTIPAALPEDFDDEPAGNARNSAERIVIPTAEQARIKEQQVRTNTAAYQQPPPSNTGKVVVLTILGTIVILAGAFGVFWFLRSQTPAANTNVNTNPYNISNNLNPNPNLNADNSFNFNLAANNNSNGNANFNAVINTNANKTPSPTPRPSASPTPRPSETPNTGNTNSAANSNSATPANTVRPTVPSVSPTPKPPAPPVSPTTPPANRPVNAGVLNGQAINLPTPAYPAPAKAVHANGKVVVQITLDEGGNVMSAKALSGNPLLRQSAESAARQARFNPIRVSGQAVSATGVLIYNFIN